MKVLVRAASAWAEEWRTETVRRRFADEAAECAAHGRWTQVPPVDVPGVRVFVAFAQEARLAPRPHLIQTKEAAAIAPHRLFHLVPEGAFAETGGDAEVHADIGDGAADRMAAHLGRELFRRGQAGRARIVGAQKRGVGAPWLEARGARAWRRSGRRTVVREQVDARRPGEAQVASPGGAGEEVVSQGERAVQAALDAVQEGGEMVGAEDGGGGGEFRGGDAGGGGRGEVAGMGDEGGENVEDGPDAAGDGAGRCGGGWGCSGHGLVVAGAREQSKNFLVGFLMNGYVEWAWEHVERLAFEQGDVPYSLNQAGRRQLEYHRRQTIAGGEAG